MNCEPCVNPEVAFLCRADRTCIAKSLVCNDHDDCSDGEDEAQCDDFYVRHHRATSRASYAVAIVLSVIVVPVVLLLLLYCLCKHKREPPLADSDDIVMVTKPLTQYDSGGANSKSGTTCITHTASEDESNATSPLYDRNHLTGASSESASSVRTPRYPHETLNPPPSPVTSHVTADAGDVAMATGCDDVFSVTSSQLTSAAGVAAPYRPKQPKALRRQYRQSHHHHHHHGNHHHHRPHHKRAIPPPPTTPCSTSVCEDSEPYVKPVRHPPARRHHHHSRGRGNLHSNHNVTSPQPLATHSNKASTPKYYPLSDSNYDSEDVVGPPPPTPARSYYFSDDLSPPPSPCTERSFFNGLQPGGGKEAPPPSPVAFSDC